MELEREEEGWPDQIRPRIDLEQCRARRRGHCWELQPQEEQPREELCQTFRWGRR